MKFWHLLTLSSLGTFAIAQEDLVDIPTTAANAGSYKTILTAIEAAGLSEILSGEGPYTVFAPSDAVFVGLDPALVPCLMAQPEALAAVLKYHVLPMKLESTKIIQTIDMEVETLNGENLSIDVVNGARVVLNDDVNVVTADISASNGVIHEIDGGTYHSVSVIRHKTIVSFSRL